MSVEHIITFNIALLVALMSPGPAFFAMLQTTLSSGRQSGLKFGLGLSSMAAIWTLLALLGLETVFHFFPTAYFIAKVICSAYLMYLAYQLWIHSSDTMDGEGSVQQRPFMQGVFINLLNPKSVFFSVAVLVAIFPGNLMSYEIVFIALNQFALEFVFYFAIAFGASTQSMRGLYIAAKRSIDRCAALLLGGLGVRLLLDEK